MDRYVIVKNTRALPRSYGQTNYQGVTLDAAGIGRGIVWYTNLDEAERDAALLSKSNPVGFHVVRLED